MSRSAAPFFPTGAVLWLDAADVSTMSFFNTDKVIQWRDKSGNENHFSAVNSTNGPTYVDDGVVFINRTAGGDTDPVTANYLSRDGFVPANPYLFVVIDSIQYKSNQAHAIYAQWQDNSRYRFVGIWDAEDYFFIRTRNVTNYTAINSSVAPGAARVLITGVWQGTDYRAIDINNSGIPAVNTASAGLTPNQSLIGIERGASGSNPASGLVATIREIIMFDGDPGSTIRSETISYLSSKWSLSL